jgi:hypothetical protein
MIKFKDKTFKDYIELIAYMIYEHQDISPKAETLFPHSKYFYIRSLLHEKFPKQKFTIRRIKQMLDEELALKNITLKEKVITAHVSV